MIESTQTAALNIDYVAVWMVKASSGVHLQLTTSNVEQQSPAPDLLQTAAAVPTGCLGAATVAG